MQIKSIRSLTLITTTLALALGGCTAAQQRKQTHTVTSMPVASPAKAERRAKAKVAISDNVQIDTESYFVPGLSIFKPGAKAKLRALAARIKARKHPAQSVVVIGYHDSPRSKLMDVSLSLARAEAVRGLLVDAGIRSRLVTAIGRGENSPVATNDNTRIDIKLVPHS
ncbi:MAG: OmpA family protein [Myxococcales bacterium]|nr:OmpA family protein [Myxococcales bacterium]